jgi:hypothetical protein
MEVLNTLTRREPRTLWKFPFERLRMSADDGARLLWLDFGGDEGEMVSFIVRFVLQESTESCMVACTEWSLYLPAALTLSNSCVLYLRIL